MKYRLLDFLQCLQCKSPFMHHVFKTTDDIIENELLTNNDLCPLDCKNPDPRLTKTDEATTHCNKCYETEIVEGLLTCNCGKAYPVVRGVPRFVPDAFEQHPEFTRKFYDSIKKYKISNVTEKEHFEKKFKEVQEMFGKQWEIWGKTERIYGFTEEQAREWFLTRTLSKKIDESYFKGKIALEVGCGHGKYVKILNDLGCENVGMDIGPSVDLVYEITKDLPTAHVIQGNAMEPPFKEGSFDYVWSHGVLHHTPSTKDAVAACSVLSKKNTGWFYVWVYHKGGFFWEYGNRMVRSITTRLPVKVVLILSYALAPLLYLIPAYNKDVNLSNVSWSECALSINDWLAPKYQWHHTAEEVISWYKELGYKDIEITPANGVGVTGVRK
jgi:SAM-dependent methyltransferase/uncharacterized protein YbaR (Trm112 family)